ncbi:MAG: pantoate--beta-alanine ligase [Sphingomonadales bacterium]|nr:pantoate--beta-alanine ligase [Sphingomonadales bacterium]
MSTAPLSIARTVAELRQHVAQWRRQGLKTAFVPTMGALHEGHLSIVRLAQRHADRVVVSIFVNPKQFGAGEDFDRYPRTVPEDVEKLESVDTSLLFLPSVAEMYPPGFATTVSVAGVSEGLCGAARPGHFDGVATVVTKLLLQCLPDVALFGEKDYQQYQVLRRLALDLDIPVAILPAPTSREPDGLARSSRNAYLSAKERQIAVALPRTLTATVRAIEAGAADIPAVLAQAADALLTAGFNAVEYVELRDSDTLRPITEVKRPARLLAAARVGNTRLIDNMAVLPPGGVVQA